MPKEDYLYQTINQYNIVAQAFIYILTFPFPKCTVLLLPELSLKK